MQYATTNLLNQIFNAQELHREQCITEIKRGLLTDFFSWNSMFWMTSNLDDINVIHSILLQHLSRLPLTPLCVWDLLHSLCVLLLVHTLLLIF